jgi:hypothetical protein
MCGCRNVYVAFEKICSTHNPRLLILLSSDGNSFGHRHTINTQHKTIIVVLATDTMATKPFNVAVFADVEAAINVGGAVLCMNTAKDDEAKKRRKKGAKTIKRERPNMDDYLDNIEPLLFR